MVLGVDWRVMMSCENFIGYQYRHTTPESSDPEFLGYSSARKD
jgi:hypothetical protein